MPFGHRGRTREGARVVGVVLVSGLLITGAQTTAMLSAAAEDGDAGTISQRQVDQAKSDVSHAARSVAAVRADLAIAAARLDDTQVTLAQAQENWNSALWKLREAQKASEEASRQAARAQHDVQRQADDYAAMLVTSYQGGSEIMAFDALVSADGISGMVERSATIDNAETALSRKYDEYQAAAAIAAATSGRAKEAKAQARLSEQYAQSAIDSARQIDREARAATVETKRRRDELLTELARLQGISKELATKRQEALEQKAQELAAAAAKKAAEKEAAEQAAAQAAAKKAADEAAAKAKKEADEKAAADAAAKKAAATASAASAATSSASPAVRPSAAPTPSPSAPSAAPAATTSVPAVPDVPVATAAAPSLTPSAEPAAPEPAPEPAPAPVPAVPAVPAVGADAAIAFARAQIGDKYSWGATGPDAWDCSGLTMGAWSAGGLSLVHYSAGQYRSATPLTAASLLPGDLVFWGSSSNPASIYHVGLYTGNGMVVHAPRTGRPVVEESMYAWKAPNFFARP